MQKKIVPTSEQEAVLDAARAGGHLKVKAYAGAGKTSTQRLIADELADRRGSYLAFNRDIAMDAKRKFPRNVSCRTFHSVAFSSVDRGLTAKLEYHREPPHELAKRYGLAPLRVPTTIGKNLEISAFQLGRMVMDGCARFCRSARPAPEAWQIPVDDKVSEAHADELQQMLLPHVVRHWTESIDVKSQVAITPDVYLKVWEQSNPQIAADFIAGAIRLVHRCADLQLLSDIRKLWKRPLILNRPGRPRIWPPLSCTALVTFSHPAICAGVYIHSPRRSSSGCCGAIFQFNIPAHSVVSP
jgi:hypothetical protein